MKEISWATYVGLQALPLLLLAKMIFHIRLAMTHILGGSSLIQGISFELPGYRTLQLQRSFDRILRLLEDIRYL